jgi:hypothetical protein
MLLILLMVSDGIPDRRDGAIAALVIATEGHDESKSRQSQQMLLPRGEGFRGCGRSLGGCRELAQSRTQAPSPRLVSAEWWWPGVESGVTHS